MIARWILLFFLGAVLSPGFGVAAQTLQAGAARVKITPERLPYLAGYSANRRAESVHDDVYASVVVIQAGETKLAIVSCDLIGLLRPAVQDIRSRVQSVPANNVLIACTHTHSGPDSIGLWGQPSQGVSGVDREWYDKMKQQVAEAIEQAAKNLQPAVLRVASVEAVPDVSQNTRVPQILDPSLAVLQLRNGDKTIATIVHYAIHPEVMNNRQLTSDVVHFLRQSLEATEGGITIFLNGALGGMVTYTGANNSWENCERIGKTLAEASVQALRNAQTIQEAPLRVHSTEITIPVENENFKMAARAGLFPEPVLQTDEVKTEVMHITLGPVEMVTLPGEALPNIGFQLKRHMKGNPKLVIGLANDELGYILSEADYALSLYRYETSMSVGEKAGRLVVDALIDMIRRASPTQPPVAVSPVESFFVSLPARFRANRAAGIKVLYRFNLSGEGGGVWEVEIAEGQCRIRKGASGNRADVTVSTTADTFLAIVQGRMAPEQAFLSGQIIIDGDLFLAQRLGEFFGF